MLWLSANLFGYRLLEQAFKVDPTAVSAIITLAGTSKTKMYDSISPRRWKRFGVAVYAIEDINKETRLIKSLNPDFIIMAGWRQLISRQILDLPKKGFIGFHPTLLPEGRGPAPIINTILMGLKQSGVTMFYVSDTLDGGDVIGQARFGVEADDYAIDIYNKAIKHGKALVKIFLPLVASGKAPRVAQNNKKATFFPLRSVKENEIKLDSESPDEIYRKIRAFSKPYNGAYLKVADNRLIIWKAGLEDGEKD